MKSHLPMAILPIPCLSHFLPMLLPLLLISAFSPFGLLAQEGEGASCARVKGDDATVHCYFDSRTHIVAELSAGTPVRVVETKEPWSRIQIPGGYPVWVHGQFLQVEEGWGTVTASRLRARPLPSTDAGVYPLGLLEKGVAVPVISVQGDWVQIQSPESLGAWVLSNSLEAETRKEMWAKDWNSAKPPVPLRPSSTSDGTESVAEEMVAPTPGLLPIAEAVVDPLKGLDPVTVAANPAVGLVKVEILLARHSENVTRDIEAYSAVTVAGIEAALSTVIWHSKGEDELERARRGLARVDALRQFRAAALAAVGRRAELEGEAKAAEASAKLRLISTEDVFPLETYTWVGWVEYRPRLFPDYPYAVIRGGRKHPVQSPDGRFRLKDFVGREVAVRGAWTRPAAAPGLRVLEISELRVLPRR